MTITAAMVKELRELTGAGVMACKKALVETDGDQEAAIEILRKKGEATAVKKSGRIAAEGVVFTAVKDGKLSLSIKEATDMMAKEVEEEVIELPDSGEEATTSLGTLFANIKLD